MVIQRSWRASSQSIESSSIHQTSSSEDSNSSWQTMSNSTSSSHHNNQRSGSTTNLSANKVSHSEMAENVLKALRSRYNGRTSMQQTTFEVAQNSMELMRLNIQHLFDREVETVVKKYIETYFEPALRNVKENLDDAGITDDYKISSDLLENAKQQYKPLSEPIATIKTEPGTVIKSEYAQTYDRSLYSFKAAPCKRKDSTSSSSEVSSSDHSPTHSHKKSPTNFHLKTMVRPKPVHWNVAGISANTLFVFDFKANRALGFLERERLTSLHPELIRYMTDTQDKEWLIQQRLLSPSHKGFRILLLVLDEVNRLGQSDECRKRANLKLNELNGFKIPEFMLHKMKMFFNELSQRSKNLVTAATSFAIVNGSVSLATLASNTTSTNTAPLNLQSALASTLSPSSSSSSSSSSSCSPTSTSSSVSSISVTTPAPPTKTHVLAVETTGNGPIQRSMVTRPMLSAVTTTNITPIVTATTTSARSSLSSSHATLSALLSNPSTENNLKSTAANTGANETSE